jgi:HAD superfamily hydrolase (TIGR01509 family)
MKQTIDAVVFDMDGLMFNTEDLYDQVGDAILAKRGQRFTREVKLAMMGLPGERAFQVMIDRCNLKDSVDELRSETEALFAEMLPREIRTMPGLLELLDRLEQNGIPKGIATSSHKRFATIALSQFDLEERFEFLLTAESVTRGKPHPEVYLMAARKMNVSPRSIVVLEDSHTGSTAAVAAGACVIAVPTEHSKECDFSHVHAVAKGLHDEIVWQTIAQGYEK